MIALVMKEDNTLLVRQDGDLRGQIAFAGESESGEYVFIPRDGTIIFRSGDLVEIARQVGLLNLETISPARHGFFSPSEDSALRTGNDSAGAKN